MDDKLDETDEETLEDVEIALDEADETEDASRVIVLLKFQDCSALLTTLLPSGVVIVKVAKAVKLEPPTI